MMDIGAVVNQSLTGMQRSQNEIARSAQQIASASVSESSDSAKTSSSSDTSPKSDLVGSLLNIKAQSQIFDSSAKVVRAASESIGTLLHVKA